MDPPRAKPRLLNKALLSHIASTAVVKQMRSARWLGAIENNVAELYMLDKRFSGRVLRTLEKYDTAELLTNFVILYGDNKKSCQQLDSKLLTSVIEHSGLVFPTVTLDSDFGEFSKLKLTDLESLKLVGTTWSGGEKLDRLVRVITENKSSLKVLLGVPEPLFGRLPSGLVLDEFSPCSVKPSAVQIPALNTKVFKYDIADRMNVPLEFMRTVNAEEIHLQVGRLVPDNAENPQPFGAMPASDRTKKLHVEFVDESSMDIDRICREVAVYCPKLECFELVHKKRLYTRCTYEEFTRAVDELVARFERTLKEADTAPYKVHLKTRVRYTYSYNNQERILGKQHSYFVKEMSSADGKNLRVDCEIVEVTESFDDDYDYLYEGDNGHSYYEDYYDPYDSDDHFGGYYSIF